MNTNHLVTANGRRCDEKEKIKTACDCLWCSDVCPAGRCPGAGAAGDCRGQGGPDYTGNVIMAQNLNYNIVSNEDLEAVQAVGMPAQPAGTPGAAQLWRRKVQADSSTATCAAGCSTCRNTKAQDSRNSRRPELRSRRKNIRSAIRRRYTLIITRRLREASRRRWRPSELPARSGVPPAGEDQLSDALAQVYADAVDSQIHDPLKDAFGDWSNADADRDGKTAFVFYPMDFAGFSTALTFIRRMSMTGPAAMPWICFTWTAAMREIRPPLWGPWRMSFSIWSIMHRPAVTVRAG